MASALDDVVRACQARLTLDAEYARRRDEAIRVREDAVRRYVAERRAEGWTVEQVAASLREALLQAGVAEGDLRGLGVSPGAIRMAVERPRP